MTPGTLYLCATPIGNLKDITLRCVEVLGQVDVVLAEDTRQTQKLMNHYQLKTPLRPYHTHNEHRVAPGIVEELKAGKTMALVSDAGVPGISDPGYHLVNLALVADLRISAIPGASSVLSALIVSGLPPMPFVFVGFLPRQAGKRKRLLETYQAYPETLVFFEAPHRIQASLKAMRDVWGDRYAAICRELTKHYEEVLRGDFSELLTHFESHEPRGEMVLVVEGDKPTAEIQAEVLQQAYQELRDRGLSHKDAVNQLAQSYHLPKNQLYNLLI